MQSCLGTFERFLFFSKTSSQLWGSPIRPVQLVPWPVPTECRQGADNYLPSSVKVKEEWSYVFTPHNALNIGAGTILPLTIFFTIQLKDN
jgi:hypothetical protein